MKYMIKNDRAEFKSLFASVDLYCTEQGVSADVVRDVNLVLEEILTNIVKYAYDDVLSHDIVVELQKEDASLLLRIEDDGKPFDPIEFYNPDIEKDFDDRNVGGMGIHLVRALTDEMRYEFAYGRNILVVKKTLR